MNEECDMFFCDSTHNIQSLTKYINVCETCWFYVMNGIHRLTDVEKAHFDKIEKERMKENE